MICFFGHFLPLSSVCTGCVDSAVRGSRRLRHVQRYVAGMNETDWDRRFLELADHIAGWSKDPSRGVGAVIVGPNKQILATGYNGLPRGVDDLPERLERPAKYDLIVHAEMNAIVHCARDGVSPVGATIYVTFIPCIRCSTVIIQSGIARVVTRPMRGGDEHWAESAEKSKRLLREAGVFLLERDDLP